MAVVYCVDMLRGYPRKVAEIAHQRIVRNVEKIILTTVAQKQTDDDIILCMFDKAFELKAKSNVQKFTLFTMRRSRTDFGEIFGSI